MKSIGVSYGFLPCCQPARRNNIRVETQSEFAGQLIQVRLVMPLAQLVAQQHEPAAFSHPFDDFVTRDVLDALLTRDPQEQNPTMPWPPRH